jgi:hypothetical protein
MQKYKISAEIAEICKNVCPSLQKSAEGLIFLQKSAGVEAP